VTADAGNADGADDSGCKDAAAGRAVSHHELAVHLFAPTGGPNGEAAYGCLLGVWDACRHRLGMDHPIMAVGLPAVPPPDLAAFTLGKPAEADAADATETAVAACERPGPGAVQAILRRHHDIACLSAILAPPAHDGLGWAELDRMWSQAAGGTPSSALLGAARLYLARLSDPAPQRVEPAPELARAVAAGLPGGHAADEDWAKRGAATASGFAVWEPAASPDDRLERRLVVVASADGDARLSAWVWSRGTTELTPFARYLLHAAKVRYQLRVWGRGRAVRELRAQVDATTGMLAGLLGSRAPSAEHLHRLWAGQADLVRVSTALAEMGRSIEIARWNMREALASEVPTLAQALGQAAPAAQAAQALRGAARGVFGDDDTLADWFARQLGDDKVFVDAAAQRAREIGDLAIRALPARGPTGPPHAGAYEPLPGPERTDLLYALAEIFTTDGAAALVLDHVGLPRHHRHALGPAAPLFAWSQMLRAMDDGAVPTPHRSLIEAALRIFPHHPVFLRLARHYQPTDTGGPQR
jgi:hypothetical protein